MITSTQISSETLWAALRQEATETAEKEPALAPFLERCILGHDSFGSALCCVLSSDVEADLLPKSEVISIFKEAIANDPSIEQSATADLQAHVERDAASASYLTPFAYHKGYHALQVYRMAHWLWGQDRTAMALFFQSRASREYDVDIHPAARIGKAIMVDHGSGLVIGETAVVEDNVSMLHGVTLGGTGKECGDRHPRIRQGVLLSAGARILGNIEIGVGAKVGASSLVLESVPPHTTYAGVPAKEVGRPSTASPALEMNQDFD